MRNTNKKTDWGRLWKRNAVVAVIALFVCAAVYLNWNYEQEAQAGKNLGQSTMVGSETDDPLLTGKKADGSQAETGDGSSSSSSATETGGSGDVSEADPAGTGDEGEAEPTGTPEDGTTEPKTGSVNTAYFNTARLNRQQARDSALSLLKEAAAGDEADTAMKEQVNETIQTMADYTVTEAQIENMITAKGYADCVAFIGEESLSLAVASPEGGLTDADTARIVDAVNQAAGFTADQVRIIPVD